MSEAFIMRIDEPADCILGKATCRIRGWYACPAWVDVSQVDLRIGDASVAWQPQARPDVAAEHVEAAVTGFIIELDLRQYLYAVRFSELALTASFPRGREMKIQFSVAPGVTARCLAAAAGV